MQLIILNQLLTKIPNANHLYSFFSQNTNLTFDQLLKFFALDNGRMANQFLSDQLDLFDTTTKRVLLLRGSSYLPFSRSLIKQSPYGLLAPDWNQLTIEEPTLNQNNGFLGQYLELGQLNNPLTQDEAVQICGINKINKTIVKQVQVNGKKLVPLVRLANYTQTELFALISDRILQDIVTQKLTQFALVRHF